MFLRPITTSSLSIALLLSLVFLTLTTCINARPYKDSPIQKIVVPYQTNTISGHPYQYPKQLDTATRNVLVPLKMDMVTSFNLDKSSMGMMGSEKGLQVNFVDGAYPVYYMPGNVNGRFNGKISLLDTTR